MRKVVKAFFIIFIVCAHSDIISLFNFRHFLSLSSLFTSINFIFALDILIKCREKTLKSAFLLLSMQSHMISSRSLVSYRISCKFNLFNASIAFCCVSKLETRFALCLLAFVFDSGSDMWF